MLSALGRHGRAGPPHSRVLLRRDRQRRALLRHGEGRRHDPAHAGRARRALARRGAPLFRVPRRRARRDPRGRLPRGGLADFGHPDGYVERQVRRWGEQWERSKAKEVPAIEELGAPAARRDPHVSAADDRARRLPPRQHDAGERRRRPHRRGARLGDGHARRSALRHRAVPRVLGPRREHARGRGGNGREQGLPHARRGRASATRPPRAATSASSTSTRCSPRTSSRSSSPGSTPAT